MTVRHRFAGPIHYAECGAGEPIVLLHQTPRSWDEFRDVLPLLGRRALAIAPDTPGFGDSAPAAEDRIEAHADGLIGLLEHLDRGPVHLVGHHTGGVIAVHIAATRPDLVRSLLLSATPFVDAAARERRRHAPVVDDAPPQADGSHLRMLWEGRRPLYPPGDTDLLTRFLIDALKAGPRAVAGHVAVGAFAMEAAAPRIRARTLLLCGDGDPAAYPQQDALAAALPHAARVVVRGGLLPLADQLPELFADVVARFAVDGQTGPGEIRA